MSEHAGNMEALAEPPQASTAQAAPQAASQLVPWATLGWFSFLLVAAFFPILRKLVDQWWTDDDVSHGFFVPIVACYIAWQRRDALLALKTKPAWIGAALMVWAGLQAFI